MVDNVRESLSALIDGEASEVEIHRLLRSAPLDGPLTASWARYHQVRGCARGETDITVDGHLDLFARISEAISLEAAHAENPAPLPRASFKPYLKPAAGLAVAASLVVAVFVGMNQGRPGVGTEALPADRLAVENLAPVDATLVAAEPAAREMDLKELDEEQLKAVRAYLNQHDRAVRMNPNMRTVIFEESKGSGQ